ncbi:hypothetical protein MBLNU230_g4978t1 [Neophaeotheca triangularis]
MAQPVSSKDAAAVLIDPMTETDPSEDTGPGSHFGSTFAPANPPASKNDTGRSSLSTNNPFRESSTGQGHPPRKASNPKSGSPSAPFPSYRDEAFGGMDPTRRRSGDQRRSGDLARHSRAGSDTAGGANRSRRSSSLKERHPGDMSNQPLEILRRDSKKAHRSPHLRKQHQPGADMIDRLDPAIGGAAYHHEGPFDAALLARNTSYKSAPLAAVESSNQEAINATPKEVIKDAIKGHKPLDHVADVPPGQPDQFGRVYDYEEGTDMMREGATTNAGYKRWPGTDYDQDDLAGKGEPAYSLDKALQAHKISDSGEMELQDRSHLKKEHREAGQKGKLDARDPVEIAGDDGAYADLQHANDRDLPNSSAGGIGRSGSLKAGLKRRIGSLRHRKDRD